MDLPEENGLTLMGPRLLLRSLTLADAADLARIGGQRDIARMFRSIPNPWPTPHLADWIGKAAWRGLPPFRLAVCLSGQGLIGTVGVTDMPVEIGYFIDPQFGGRGYATEAAQTVLAFLFDQFDLDQVLAEHFDDNPASARVLGKLGFEKMGHGRAQSLARLEPAPNTHYRLKRTDFLRLDRNRPDGGPQTESPHP